MRLGVVLTGLGAHAAASAGALEWMLDAGVRPYALCGMQSSAWASALYLAGYDAKGIKAAVMQAARLGRRLSARRERFWRERQMRSARGGGWKNCFWRSWANGS